MLLIKIRTLISRYIISRISVLYYRKIYGVSIGRGARISSGAIIDRTNPRGIQIGEYTYVTYGANIMSHDFVGRKWKKTVVGRNCFLGYRAVILPGVTIGDGSIIGAGAVVTRDVPKNSVAVGNPAMVIESNVVTDKWGIRLDRGNPTPVED